MGTIWTPDLKLDEGPKYKAVLDALAGDVENGTLEAGAKLPPVRELAWAVGVTPGTIARAYQEGVAQGLLEAQVGRGTFVRQVSKATDRGAKVFDAVYAGITRDGSLNLRNTNTTDVGQGADIRAAMIRVANSSTGDYVNYPGAEGRHALYPDLIDWIGHVGVTAKPEQLLLTHGGQNAITIATQAILGNTQGKVGIEALCYPGIRYAVEGQGGVLVGIPIDKHGILPDALEKQCRAGGMSAVFLSANVLNPTTGCMPLERRLAITEIARRYDLQIIEDDCWAIGPSEIPSFQTLAPERAWYISSFSKMLSAGLRFGYLIAPETHLVKARRVRRALSFGVSRAVTDLAYELLRTGDAIAIRTRIAERVAGRVAHTVNLLGQWEIRYRFDVPFIWLRLPKGWRAAGFAAACERVGVLVRPSDEFTIEGMPVPHAVRISINCNLDDEVFDEALEKINRILATPPLETEA